MELLDPSPIKHDQQLSLPVLFPSPYHCRPAVTRELCLWPAGWLGAGQVSSQSLGFSSPRCWGREEFEPALDILVLSDLERLQKPRHRWT